MRRSSQGHLHLSNKSRRLLERMAEQKEDKSVKAGRVSQTVYRRSVLKQITE